MKKIMCLALLAAAIMMISPVAQAGRKADIKKMQEMVLNGQNVVQTLGKDAYAGINDPKGQFVWLDKTGAKNNVGVIDCAKGIIVADYEVPGMNISEIKDAKNGDQVLVNVCKNVSPKGEWIDFSWNDASQGNKPARSILFYIPVPDTKLIVYTFGWDDDTSLEELNKNWK